ncbi:MAG: aminopeptidase [Saprospiraceae bacterium]|nr:aminopeptidase [Saprospiraceae bacterium]
MMNLLSKYAHLLVNYCLELKEGEKLYISTTTLAEPLVREVYKEAMKCGAHVEVNMSFREQNRIFLKEGNRDQLEYISPSYKVAVENYDAFLTIRAPFNLKEDQNNDREKSKIRQEVLNDLNQTFFRRNAEKSLKRCVCQFPTQASAQEAGMSLEEYEEFVYNACHLYADDPKSEWLKVRETQQKMVDYLNVSDKIRYLCGQTDIEFSVKDRIWINSDGRANMPSGEVFTGPVENSVNGVIYFNFPSIYMGNEVEGITLWVKEGKVYKWHAEKGQTFLDMIFSIEGAEYFGEVAIGTNYNIQKATKNILFDEKIGGTVHMAIGQSYIQTGGLNKSAIHWDMITDMKNGGEIYADDKLIYKNGFFLLS